MNAEKEAIIPTPVRHAVLLHDALNTLLACPSIYSDECFPIVKNLLRATKVQTSSQQRLVTALFDCITEEQARREHINVSN